MPSGLRIPEIILQREVPITAEGNQTVTHLNVLNRPPVTKVKTILQEVNQIQTVRAIIEVLHHAHHLVELPLEDPHPEGALADVLAVAEDINNNL